ncbi:MAG TPA: hypothetical protein VGA46_03490 [Methyloceanibacter sp.]|jgi:hypothetical protein
MSKDTRLIDLKIARETHRLVEVVDIPTDLLPRHASPVLAGDGKEVTEASR